MRDGNIRIVLTLHIVVWFLPSTPSLPIRNIYWTTTLVFLTAHLTVYAHIPDHCTANFGCASRLPFG